MTANRSPRTLIDYERATEAVHRIARRHFGWPGIQSHSSPPVSGSAKIDVPIKQFRTGKLRTATLPELAPWGREHANAQKIGAGTINKLLGARASRSADGRAGNSLLPDDWADPFADMRCGRGRQRDARRSRPEELAEPSSARLYSRRVSVHKGGQVKRRSGCPCSLCSGGERLSELAGLRASDVVPQRDQIGSTPLFTFTPRPRQVRGSRRRSRIATSLCILN